MRSLLRRGEDGASAVEFALVLPILIILLAGIIQFGFLFFQWLEVTHAAREGARWASLRNTEADVRTRVIESAPGLNAARITMIMDPTNTASNVGKPVRVTVTYPTPIFTPLMGKAFGGGLTVTLRSSATQRIE